MVGLSSYGILHKAAKVCCGLTLLLASSCSDVAVKAPETSVLVIPAEVVSRPAPVPPGVVRYCWEEPIVELEPNGPGVDAEGNWYHMGYQAIRETRQGRWRPCQPVASETAGGVRQ